MHKCNSVLCSFLFLQKCYEGTVFVCGLKIIHFRCHAWSDLHFEASYTSATLQSTGVLS